MKLDFDAPPHDPFDVFTAWFEEAAEKAGLPNPNAMTVATATPDGRPTARIVLLKQYDHRGFVFFTNRESRKGVELGENPRAALLMHWDTLDRQVRIEGSIEPTTDAESDAYFSSRPLESRLNAIASDQSRPIEDRASLEARRARVDATHADGSDPARPPHWGGYRLRPERFEFWQGHPFRLHDRVTYVADGDRWKTMRLMP
ncbi:MAG: pyridoxamine 5'-phosphate oxidase [Planctomycetaceae bacterium]|nr:pyridoxamine 5'-phosphate oxidase [Planctomycetaceae bacterium]